MTFTQRRYAFLVASALGGKMGAYTTVREFPKQLGTHLLGRCGIAPGLGVLHEEKQRRTELILNLGYPFRPLTR
jgi:hypothetical protein